MIEVAEKDAAKALLRWYREMGVDEAVADVPSDFFTWGPAPMKPANAQRRATRRPAVDTGPSEDEAVQQAGVIARACDSFEALADAVAAFEGCALKAAARNTVFTDGVQGSDLLVIGEAPGRDEDRIGRPFVGRAGKLLDKMLAAIDHSREKDVLISNVLFWRPPGNRTPTQIEIATCRPFVDRLIELTNPKALLLTGGASLQALTGVTGIMRARGVWREIETSGGQKYPVLPTFHPAYLLRQPASKRLAWSDLQSLAARLRED